MYHNQGRSDTGDGESVGLHMTEELTRKNIQVSIEVYDTLTSLKRGNMTYTDVCIILLKRAGVEMVIN
jgi:hypothetical protein